MLIIFILIGMCVLHMQGLRCCECLCCGAWLHEFEWFRCAARVSATTNANGKNSTSSMQTATAAIATPWSSHKICVKVFHFTPSLFFTWRMAFVCVPCVFSSSFTPFSFSTLYSVHVDNNRTSIKLVSTLCHLTLVHMYKLAQPSNSSTVENENILFG